VTASPVVEVSKVNLSELGISIKTPVLINRLKAAGIKLDYIGSCCELLRACIGAACEFPARDSGRKCPIPPRCPRLTTLRAGFRIGFNSRAVHTLWPSGSLNRVSLKVVLPGPQEAAKRCL
jgi:hypothetical protein